MITTIQETLEYNNIAPARVAAVLTVGGGSSIPLVTQQLSERLRCPIIAAPHPQLAVAFGAAIMAGQPDETPSAEATMRSPEATMLRPIATGEETAKSPASAPVDTVESGLAWSESDTSPELQEYEDYQDYSTPTTTWFFAAAVFSAAVFTALFIAWQDRDEAPAPSNRTSTTTTATSTPHP
ncbi:proline rich protein [Mycobacteroides abscessus subsp. abscessus]|nr:proline rich protein [Mycobacteroides abscessus subsp. abscessus]